MNTRSPSQALAPAASGRSVAHAAPRWRLASMLVLVVLVAALGAWLATSGVAQKWKTPSVAAQLPSPAEAPPASLLVLPPQATEGAGEALADGLHRDLVGEAARLKGHTIIARDTAAAYAGREVDLRQAAREVGVRHVLRSSVRGAGGMLVVDVAMVDADSGATRWSASHPTTAAQLRATVAAIGAGLQQAMQVEFTRAGIEKRVDRVDAPPPRASLTPAQVAADELAMRGFLLLGRGADDAARALFDQAVAKDADSIRGWSGLAWLHGRSLVGGGAADTTAALARLDEAVSQLRRLDASGIDAVHARTLQLWARRDWAALLQHTTAQLERHAHPLTPAAHGTALLLTGRTDDAVMFFLWALRSSPMDPQRADWQYRIAFAHFAAGRDALARDWALAAAATDPATPWPPVHAAAMLRLGDADAARAALAARHATQPRLSLQQVDRLLPSDEPRLAAARAKLVQSLRELGMS